MKKNLKYFLLFAIMTAIVISCKSPSLSGNQTNMPVNTDSVYRHLAEIKQQFEATARFPVSESANLPNNGFYGLSITPFSAGRAIPDSVNRLLSAEIKQQFAANGLLPETKGYTTPRNITQAQIDSLKAIYYPLALKGVALFSDTTKFQKEWDIRVEWVQNMERSQSVKTQAEFAALQPVNLIPVYEYANRTVDFYEQDPATRNIIDYLKLKPDAARVVMADTTGNPVTILMVTLTSIGRAAPACKDYTDKMNGFSFMEQGLSCIPGFEVAFIRNDSLYGLELHMGTIRRSTMVIIDKLVSRDESIEETQRQDSIFLKNHPLRKDTVYFEHKVDLYNVQNVKERRYTRNEILSGLESQLRMYLTDMENKKWLEERRAKEAAYSKKKEQ